MNEMILTTAIGYSKQGMENLNEAVSSYMHILPDEEYSEKPIYSTGGSMNGGIEPAGYKLGYILRSFGK